MHLLFEKLQKEIVDAVAIQNLTILKTWQVGELRLPPSYPLTIAQ